LTMSLVTTMSAARGCATRSPHDPDHTSSVPQGVDDATR
jgi:hypothetical protein